MELSETKVFQLSKSLYNEFNQHQNEERLDPDSLQDFEKKEIKPLYPHKKVGGDLQKYKVCQVCCDIQPGRFCCCSSSAPDNAYRKFGLGICLYFKFVKHFTCYYAFIFLLSLFACCVCYFVAVQNNADPLSNYQNFLFSTTLGAFSGERLKCNYQLIKLNTATVTLQCPYGQINDYGAVFSEQSKASYHNCKNQIKKFEDSSSTYSINSFVVGSPVKTCNTDNTECTVSYTFNGAQTYSIISYGYYCSDNVYTINSISLQSNQIMYILVAIDLILCVTLLLFMISQKSAEEDQKIYFKGCQLSLQDFSIKITGFSLDRFDDEFKVFMDEMTKVMGSEFIDQVVMIKKPDKQEYIDYQNEKNELYEKLYDLIDNTFYDQMINPNDYRNSGEFKQRHFNGTEYQQYKQKFQKYVGQYVNLKEQRGKTQVTKRVSIFLVLNKMKIKKRIYKLQRSTCCQQGLPIGNKWYGLSEPPAPDLIQWQNKGKLTCFRMIVSWLLTFAICFGSYLLFGYINYQQNKLLKNYNFQVDCDVLYTTAVLKVYQNSLSSDQTYNTCYCLENLFEFTDEVDSHCDGFRTQYFTYLAIPLIISAGIVIYNLIVSKFFKLLTKMECHRLITSELYSYTIKRSFILVMNMGLIMILLNVSYDNSVDIQEVSFLFLGKYSDFSADWFLAIGSVIIITLIFNIAFPIIQFFLACFLDCFRKCWDTKCCTRKTSKKTKREYIDLYSNSIYPLEERYAYLISFVLIVLTFNGVIPILNVILFIALILLYFIDKVLIFRFFQTPLNYNGDLHSLMLKSLYAGLVIHLGLTAFLLSEPTMVAENSQVSQNSRVTTENSRINSILQTSYIIPYVCLFLLLIFWAIFKNTFVRLFSKCCEEKEHVNKKYNPETSFFDTLSSYQIIRLKLLKEDEINILAHQKSQKSLILDEGQINLFMNLTNKQMTKKPRKTVHEEIINRTLKKLRQLDNIRNTEHRLAEIELNGLPGYAVMANDKSFQQNRRNIMLKNVLREGLRNQRQMTFITENML